MQRAYIRIFTPIVSMLILTVGNGLFTTMTSLQLKTLSVSDFFVGCVAAAYFLGLMIGSYTSQRFIIRVGHIRAYAAFATIMTVATLLQGMVGLPWLWLVLRFIVGYGLAGLFIVIESWMLGVSNARNKGRIMACYLLSYYIAQALGQLFIKIQFSSMLMSFCVVAVFSALSVLPIAITRFNAPVLKASQWFSPLALYRKSPLGLWISVISGMILGVIYAIYPLFLLESNLSHNQIATVMFVTILGGALLQLPVGKLSDQFDRRKVLLLITILSCVLCAYLVLMHRGDNGYVELLISSFFLGGMCFAIYPIGISHTSDCISPQESVGAISILTFFYGLGSGAGPLIVPGFMSLIGPDGFFVFLFVVSAILAVFTLWRIGRRRPPADKDKGEFISTAPGTFPIAEDVVAKED